PCIRGTAQNPDVYFQTRETVNPFYMATPGIVQDLMDRFAERTGRQYHLFDYVGAADAERVIVVMGSAAQVVEETIGRLQAEGAKVGLVKVHLYRPFSAEHFVRALPDTVKRIAVLDRTKEPGSAGEPLYLDVVASVTEAMGADLPPFKQVPQILGGRYGLSSKEFTPAMVRSIFEALQADRPKNHFTIGIKDDVTHTSLDFDESYTQEGEETVRALFYGLGSDGTVGANKNSIRIIGEATNLQAQGYFVYDSKKSGSVTISHLRFGPRPIKSSYLIQSANFVACHQFGLLERFDALGIAEPGATLLLNTPYASDQVWEHLPGRVQRQILEKGLKVFVIDAYRVAQETGMGARINTVMQTCFFAISGVLPREQAIAAIKKAIEKTYGKRGEAVVQRNFAAVDNTLAHLHTLELDRPVTAAAEPRPIVAAAAPPFVQHVTAPIMAGKGEDLPVSAMPVDGTYPSGTAQWEKRNISLEIPEWDEATCIQCGKCVMVCPHAVIRAKVYDPVELDGAPEHFLSAPARWKEFPGSQYTLQVAPEDCTGCRLCVEVCPAKNKRETRLRAINMVPQPPIHEREKANWEFFLNLPETDRRYLNLHQVKDAQLLQPLFEFSGACAGCGETPYVKLVSQLFGDRVLIANATGCSSIYGGNLPTTPWTFNREGRGPAWSNSLFEDNAEFGLGFRLTLDKQIEYACELLPRLESVIGGALVYSLLHADQTTDAGIRDQRSRVDILKERLHDLSDPPARDLLSLADVLVSKTVWIIGGDGWAYDIGYGGLDHVLASGRKVNVLVLDTEVYSNTGGQMSKATPRGAVAKFAAGGKMLPKKDLALLAMTYGHIYVARVAMGANDAQTIKAFLEAEAYDGPSLIHPYSHCIAHGIDMSQGLNQQKAAVASGYWPLFRYNPALLREGKNTLVIDSKPPSIPLEKYAYNETRYAMLAKSNRQAAEELMLLAQHDVDARWQLYEQLAAIHLNGATPPGGDH
ncbi:MAG: pyruvate:ferredoxin (flavodoxin) oxidoreductase, partial [Acidobacteria bacterium]|nr:pyruvate:ferredoxin (flavodoxin) oxidoreductase [Acidobacteriota bacterium]